MCVCVIEVFMCVFCVQDAALERDVDFWISLSCQFDVSDQLTSLVNVLNFLLQLPDDKDDGETNESRRLASLNVSHTRKITGLFRPLQPPQSVPPPGEPPRRTRSVRRS